MNTEQNSHVEVTHAAKNFTVIRPNEAIETLINHLSPLGSVEYFRSGQRVPMVYKGEKVIYVLLKGCLSYYNGENDRVLGYVYPPSLIGVIEMFSSVAVGYVRVEEEAKLICVKQTVLTQLLDTNPNLWTPLAQFMSYVVLRVLHREAMLQVKDSYTIIRNLLSDLASQPPEVRSSVTASRFILERAMIARSTVMSILSQLQRGGFITLEKGLLVAMRVLPEKF